MRKFEFQNKNHSASGRPVDWGTCMWVGICVDTETGASGAHSSRRRGQCGCGEGSEEKWTDLREMWKVKQKL